MLTSSSSPPRLLLISLILPSCDSKSPPSDVKREFFTDSQTHTTCGWKGVASYYNADVNGKKVSDVAWYYPQAKDKAKDIEGYVAFYKNKVEISG
ncbi:hypothetical protein NBRC10512_003838 [Rhodotorula toruloides]|uniref:RHTO0S02e04742g1_1 n=2 Tax=Rhodotorula toruloides TaxID=5286 RepID=A0A061AGG1_RHOTO|nr:uncharacterized protein RHTO_01160 [Rhodotorula toruloides NP11]EMS21945.1 hypothetical protein RHTO_01160 [Rhodotorula toruloides NP11]CDR36631.1 RHTO0S02e04742g1_1 [Rhodotorula toruloides]